MFCKTMDFGDLRFILDNSCALLQSVTQCYKVHCSVALKIRFCTASIRGFKTLTIHTFQNVALHVNVIHYLTNCNMHSSREARQGTHAHKGFRSVT